MRLLFYAAPRTFSVLYQSAKDSQALVDFSQIRHFEIGLMHFDESINGAFLEFLQSCCKNVETYCVAPGCGSSSIDEDSGIPPFNLVLFSFWLLPGMRHLIVKIPYFFLPYALYDASLPLLEALDTFSSQDGVEVRLETLDFGIDFGSSEPEDVTEIIDKFSTERIFWRCLDVILCRRAFSSLKAVTVHAMLAYCTFRQSQEELDQLKDTTCSYMSGLEEKEVDFVVEFNVPKPIHAQA